MRPLALLPRSALALTLVIAGCGDTESPAATESTSGATTTAAVTGGAGGEPSGTTPGTTSPQGGGGTGGAPSTGGASTGGEGGTGGIPSTGGAGGATSSTTSTTTATTTTTTSGPDPGGPCTWGDDCGGNLYCFAPGCGAGTCQKPPVPAGLPPEQEPVCGCDGVTYWNEAVAASQKMSVLAAGACVMVLPCGPGLPCPAGQDCNRKIEDAAACDPDAAGECWGTALSCPLDGSKGRACTNGQCEIECSLIQSENPWYPDPTCN